MLYSEPSVTSKYTQLVPLRITDSPRAEPLFGLSRTELTAVLEQAGEPAWRSKQLADALYRQWTESLGEISTFSKDLRDRLQSRGWQVGRPSIAQVFRSTDGTERYLVEG